MRSVTILSAHLNEVDQRIEVVKLITNDDGSTEYNCHSFHPETLEWRAAEFGLENIEEALDAVLFEPYVEAIDHLRMSAQDCRTAHLARVGEAKSRLTRPNGRSNLPLVKTAMLQAGIPQRYVEAADNEPRQAIKDACPFDDEALQIKREYIERLRGRPAQPEAVRSRIDLLRERLGGSPGSDRQVPTASASSSTGTKVGGELPTVVLSHKRS